ncbi:MAG: hypothetical protein AAGN82_08880 [Myxococcota bacterium]
MTPVSVEGAGVNETAEAHLAHAIAMTRALLGRDEVTPEATQALLATRAELVARARALRPHGWTAGESELVARLVDADRALVARLWSPRRDAFRWLRGRNEEATKSMPLLRALDDD